MVSAWASVPEEVVHRSFSASGLIASDNWQEGVHSRLREKILPDEPVVMNLILTKYFLRKVQKGYSLTQTVMRSQTF